MYIKRLIKKHFCKTNKKIIIQSDQLKTALTKKEIYQIKLKQFPNDKKIILKIKILDLIINYLMEIQENGK